MYQIYQNLSKVESMHKHLTISIKRYISTSKKQCITINSQNMTVSQTQVSIKSGNLTRKRHVTQVEEVLLTFELSSWNDKLESRRH